MKRLFLICILFFISCQFVIGQDLKSLQETISDTTMIDQDSIYVIDFSKINKNRVSQKLFWDDAGVSVELYFRSGKYYGKLANNLKSNGNIGISFSLFKKRISTNMRFGYGGGSLNESITNNDGITWDGSSENYFFELSCGYHIFNNKYFIFSPYFGINASSIDSGCVDGYYTFDNVYICVIPPLVSIGKWSPIVGFDLGLKFFDRWNEYGYAVIRYGIISQKFNKKYDYINNGYEHIISIGIGVGGLF